MNAMVVCEDSMGGKVELTSKGVNAVNLGSVEINEESMRNITIFNAGKFNFDYEWELTERYALCRLYPSLGHHILHVACWQTFWSWLLVINSNELSG